MEVFPRSPDRAPAVSAAKCRPGSQAWETVLPPGLRGRALRGPRLGGQSRREGACRPELGVGFKIRVDWGYGGDSVA